jgi:hypothetical protein
VFENFTFTEYGTYRYLATLLFKSALLIFAVTEEFPKADSHEMGFRTFAGKIVLRITGSEKLATPATF